MGDTNKRPAHWMPRKGDRVDYHSIIGEPATSMDHVVRTVETSHSGYPVAWLVGKSGCVACDALTPSKERADISCHLCGIESPQRFLWCFGKRKVFICRACAVVLGGE